MSQSRVDTAMGRRLRGGIWGPLLVLMFVACAGVFLYGVYLYPHTARAHGYDVGYNRAMFGEGIEQPIPFSHRLHATDKEIDCFYCHPYGERSLNAGLPSVEKMVSRGVQRFIEIGPGSVLTGLVRRIDKNAALININDTAALDAFLHGA